MDIKQVFILFIYLEISLSQRRNNVCKNFADFINIDHSFNCWYNPDVFATPENIIRNHGFKFEKHSLITEDGYNLTLFRVQNNVNSTKKQPVLLHHGLLSSAVSFIFAEKKSLAFYLAERNYDVWLANSRGTNYSPTHLHLKITDPEFWKFSVHDIANDLPAVIEYVTERNGNGKIIYVGHSMGCAIFFIYSSLKKDHAEKFVKGYIGLSPPANMKYVHPLVKSIAPLVNQLVQGLISNNINVLFPEPEKFHRTVMEICRPHPVICLTVLVFVCGKSSDLNPSDLMVALSLNPTRTSVKAAAHFLQMVVAGRFQHYDYGPEENMKKYNSTIPPQYPLSEITVPTHLFYSLDDNLVYHKDVVDTYSELTMSEKSLNLVPANSKENFNHINFIMDNKIEEHLYKKMIKIIKKLEINI